MAVDYSVHLQSIPPYGVANRRTEKDFRFAKRYSMAVKALRFALPSLAAFVLVGFVATVVTSYVPPDGISVGGASLKDGKLVMETPKMAGFDSRNRPYDVKADRAIQDLKSPNMIELETINALLPMDEKGGTTVIAKSGTYDTEAETLQLRGDIRISGARGMNIEMQIADIDMKAGSLESLKPVSVTSDDAVINADKVFVTENGKRIIFRDRVKMTITRPVATPESAGDAKTETTGTLGQ